jgi:hypothetical protein
MFKMPYIHNIDVKSNEQCQQDIPDAAGMLLTIFLAV